MFLGTHKTYFSGKNRIILPKKFRKELGNEDKFYIVMGLDGEIWGFVANQWQKEVEKKLAVPLTEKEGRRQRRIFFSQADECILDSQGRFILSQEFVERAGIKNGVLLAGAGDHFEIWDPELFKKLMQKI